MNRFLVLGILILSTLSFSATTTYNSTPPVKNVENKNIESSVVAVPETKKVVDEKKAAQDGKCAVAKDEKCPAIKKIINEKPPVPSKENPEIKEEYKD